MDSASASMGMTLVGIVKVNRAKIIARNSVLGKSNDNLHHISTMDAKEHAVATVPMYALWMRKALQKGQRIIKHFSKKGSCQIGLRTSTLSDCIHLSHYKLHLDAASI